MLVLGYDPGGDGKHGVAALRVQASSRNLETEIVATAADAVAWFRSRAKKAQVLPAALGVDTLTFWELGQSGDRAPDRWLRTRYPDMKKSVVRANSLYGAMVISGVAVARRLRAIWPSLQINETHPKVLFYALKGVRPDWSGSAGEMSAWLLSRCQAECLQHKEDHMFDAVISACITAEALDQPRNFVNLAERCPDGACRESPEYPAGIVTYWWPLDSPPRDAA